MKLFFCTKCYDVIKPKRGKGRVYCDCRKSFGEVFVVEGVDTCEKMEIGGFAVPFALCNNHLNLAHLIWNNDKRTSFIRAWTIDTTQEINGCTVVVE